MELIPVNHISLNQITLEWFREFICRYPKYLNLWENPNIRLHFYQKEHNLESLKLGGQLIFADWDDKIIYFTLYKKLIHLHKNKFNWKQSVKYVGINEDILRFMLEHEFVRIDVSTNEGMFFVPLKIAHDAVENNWIAKISSSLKIYAIPIVSTPRKWNNDKQNSRKITDYVT